MKKLFLLIPTLLLTVALNAAVMNVTTSSYEGSDVLRKALYYSNAGDTIVMATGTYEESNSDYIAWKRDNVVMAAEGASVIIKPHVSFRVKGGARAELIGVKIDASEINSISSDYKNIFESGENVDGNRLILKNCEIYGNPAESVVRCASDKKLDSLIINDCYIHDNSQVVLRLESASLKGLTITNSTIANIANGGSFWVAPISVGAGTDLTVFVDHCTFYHNTSISSSYADVTVSATGADVIVSNCIFAQPASYDGSRAVYLNGGTVQNCLTFNYTKSTDGISGETTKENCIAANPLFMDASNGNYSYPGDWVTPSISPARGAATDGSDLGDPRWYSAEVLPEVDFAEPYHLVGAKAKLAGKIWYDSENGYIYGDGGHNKDYGTATWKFHAEKACIVGVAVNLNSGNTSGHKLRVEVLDADGNGVGEFAEETSTLPGVLSIPAEGDYTIILHNDKEWSSAKIDNITLSYIGGDIQAMPGTTDINDAWFSANGTRVDGKISYTSIGSGCWAKWNINVASAGTYNVTVNIQNVYGHNYSVEFLKEGSNTPIVISEGETKYGHDATLYPVEVGAVALEAGNYEMKVSNAIGDAALLGVKLAYAGGAAIDLSKTTPASLLANADAIVSDDWTIEDGKITHAESKALTGWAKWNVNCADYGNYHVAVNISSDNGHGVRVEVFEDEAQPAIYTLDEPSAGKYHTGDLALDLGSILLADREYVVKVSNTVGSSHVQIASIVITYVNGAQATLPATFNFEDGMLSEKAHITAGELWFNTIGDSNPVGQWAKWNVKVAEAGTFLFTMNVNSSNGQSYKISILNGETEMDAFESGSVGNGDKTVKHYFNLAAGNYTVKLENTYPWSQGHIVSLEVTLPSLLILDEAAETNTVIVDNYRNGTHDIQIIRTIVADMYNTICLPFDVNEAQLKAIFGSDVELKQLSSAELNGEELDLIFDDVTSGIYRGTPYLIKTSSNVVNPTFVDVEIKEKTGQATSCTNADFIGSFIKGEVPAGENNLFLGPNDLLYFSQDPTPIKGMRAWFQVKGIPNPSLVIKRANIVTKKDEATNIEIVNSQDSAVKSQKLIRDGQLIIISDGVQYNVMGVKIN